MLVRAHMQLRAARHHGKPYELTGILSGYFSRILAASACLLSAGLRRRLDKYFDSGGCRRRGTAPKASRHHYSGPNSHPRGAHP
jgi:hypothetical protein